jgi:polar amino acid transport system substrate-binding protein|tara:strand:- start:342 stop:1154 length:813 start_codon:yes stop_codon:yes gene_type:complete
MNKQNKIYLAVGIIAILVIAIGLFSINKNDDSPSDNSLRVGYIIYPPLLEKDASTGQFQGISYDIVEAIAEKIGVETEWAEEVGWGTSLEGLKTNRYDILGTQMWPNEEREKVVSFSIAPMDSVIYGYVKQGDTRFNDDFSVLNSNEYKITSLDGEMAMFIAQEDYPNAQLVALPQLSSYAEVFLNVVQDKADITFAEPSTAEGFLKSNPNSLDRVSGEAVRSFGNSFAFNKEDIELREKWTRAIQELIDEGEIQRILEKHGVENYYEVN